MKPIVVVDLGFGDAGKGLVTDALVRALGARAVVRFNGGAQAGHNVVTEDGRHHTFSQLGAGTFVPGVRTILSRHVVVHPTALLLEAAHLASVDVRDALDRLSASASCRVVTPFHQAANRLREIARGAARHGSCGVGVGETMRDALEHPEGEIRLEHLRDRVALRRLLRAAQERLRAAVDAEVRAVSASNEIEVLEDPRVVDAWIDAARVPLSCIVDDDALSPAFDEDVIFEGAQGVLLDEWRGFHPYTTWSTCTFDNALELLDGREAVRLGVLRTYATRHGAGPFPTETPEIDLPEPHNAHGPWQGAFRRGFLDLPLLRYALEVVSFVDGLAVTHLDALPRLGTWRACRAYDVPIVPGPPRDLAHQEALTRTLFSVKPVVEPLAGMEALEEALSSPVLVTSRGPTARDVTLDDRLRRAVASPRATTLRRCSRSSAAPP